MKHSQEEYKENVLWIVLESWECARNQEQVQQVHDGNPGQVL